MYPIKTTIIETIKRVLGAVMYGIVLTCLVQGALGGLGFWAAGLPSSILFGTLMAISALIPIIGTALIWLPGALYLLMRGQTLHALLLIMVPPQAASASLIFLLSRCALLLKASRMLLYTTTTRQIKLLPEFLVRGLVTLLSMD